MYEMSLSSSAAKSVSLTVTSTSTFEMERHPHTSTQTVAQKVQHTTSSNRTVTRKSLHHKVRTGCATCKARKVKCDEVRPACRRCISTGRKCDGYHPPRAIVFEVFDNQKEARSFQYFLEKSAFLTSMYQISTARFWTTLGPQTSHAHPSVRHMLIAIASLQESFYHSYDPTACRDLAKTALLYALEQYSKAVKALAAPSSVEVPNEIVLTCCILFTTFETFQNHGFLATMHTSSGLKILLQHITSEERSRTMKSSIIHDQLIPIFQRLGIDACAFTDDYPPADAWFDDDCSLEKDLQVPTFFFNIYEAYECMDGFLKCIFRATSNPTKAKKIALKKLSSVMPEYPKSLDMSMKLLPRNKDAKFGHGVRCLKVHHRVGTIMMQTLLLSDETAFDSFNDDFEKIVLQSNELLEKDTKAGMLSRELFGLHLGFIPPLFFTATRCRDPLIRRRAIKTLHDSRRRERVWDSCGAARIAERIMMMEERGLVVKQCQDVPASSRVMLVSQNFNSETYTTSLQFRHAPWDETAPLEEDLLSWQTDHVSAELLTPELTSKKILRAAGYAGNLLSCRTIQCRCPANASPL